MLIMVAFGFVGVVIVADFCLGALALVSFVEALASHGQKLLVIFERRLEKIIPNSLSHLHLSCRQLFLQHLVPHWRWRILKFV